MWRSARREDIHLPGRAPALGAGTADGFADLHEAWAPMERGEMTAGRLTTRPASRFGLLKPVRPREGRPSCFSTSRIRRRRARPADLELQFWPRLTFFRRCARDFRLARYLFLPFLLIDIVVASVTLSIGMVQLPPAMVSAPFKILLFVLVDGWNLTIGSLMKGLLRMTPGRGGAHCRADVLAAFWIMRSAPGHRFRDGHRDQPDTDCDVDSGSGIQRDSSSDRFLGGACC